jgi:tetratricopeptide (TPR) repeat protein
LESATRLDPGDAGPGAKARAWRALAQIEMRAGEHGGKVDTAQASIDLLEALKLSPETPADTLMAARLAEANGDHTGAEAAYRRLLKADAKQPEAQAGLAHLLIAEKKYPEAEELLQAALKNSPDDPALTAQLAAVFVAEDKADALPLLQQFHEKHSQDNSITRMLAQVEADAGEYDESDRLYLALLATSPRDSELLAGHGQNLIRLHRYPEAMKAFETATAIDETNGEAWNGLAFAAFETHQPAVTLHALTIRSKYLPENATILFLWATAYDTLHDKKQAVAYYHKFLDSAAGKLPDQEWQARQRLALMEKTP